MITPRSAPAVTTCGFTLLAVALVAATIHVTAPDYARIRAGRVDAGYLQRKKGRGIAKKWDPGLAPSDCVAFAEAVLCTKGLNRW